MRRRRRRAGAFRPSGRPSTSTPWSAASTPSATCRPATRCTDDDVYLAIPLQKGQISCRELMRGEVLLHDVCAHDAPIVIDAIDSPYATSPSLRQLIEGRGI